jgi:hypothetical protein
MGVFQMLSGGKSGQGSAADEPVKTGSREAVEACRQPNKIVSRTSTAGSAARQIFICRLLY